jgi:predicted nucleic acid-binding protein
VVKWLLDTNALSELTRPAPDRKLVAWLDRHEEETGVSVITIGELVAGIERLPDGKRRRALERALKFFRQDYAGKTFDFTEGAAVEWGRLIVAARNAGRSLSVLDSQIEAIAIHHGLTVVTRNGRDFFHPVVNPWEEEPSS